MKVHMRTMLYRLCNIFKNKLFWEICLWISLHSKNTLGCSLSLLRFASRFISSDRAKHVVRTFPQLSQMAFVFVNLQSTKKSFRNRKLFSKFSSTQVSPGGKPCLLLSAFLPVQAFLQFLYASKYFSHTLLL